MLNIGNLSNTNLDFDYIPQTTRLSGVTFEGRQDIINNLQPNTDLLLIRDPQNQYDRYAIKVVVQDKDGAIDIGWIPKDLARVLAPEMDAGIQWQAKVEKITGFDQPTRGIVIRLIYNQQIKLDWKIII